MAIVARDIGLLSGVRAAVLVEKAEWKATSRLSTALRAKNGWMKPEFSSC